MLLLEIGRLRKMNATLPKIAIAFALLLWSVAAQAAMFEARSAAAAPRADAYFSPAGHDSEGHAIGADCTYASPCRTVEKALSFLAQNIAQDGGAGAGASYNYKLLFDGGAEPFYLPQTALFTSAHTVNAGFSTTFDVYNGAQAVWSGGRDIAGTWRAIKLPNGTGAAACVSDALAGSAPLTGANAKLYVGVMWVNGKRAQEVINPRIGPGNAWKTIPGVPGEIVGSSVATSPTATLTRGSADIGISDLSRIGMVGETIGFNDASPPFKSIRRYWIVSKSPATGSGNIAIASKPGGPPIVAITPATLGVQDPVQSSNGGDRTHQHGINRFPYNGTDFESRFNQTDVKAQVAAGSAGGDLIPVFTASDGAVTLNSRPLKPDPDSGEVLRAGMGYRVWNRFEDLGAGGYVGEVYTDRSAGLIYYTPRAGETCASINAPGNVIIPGPLETLLEISSSAHDAALTGGAIGAPVGNLVIRNIAFEHTNSSVFTGVNDISGAVGGYIVDASAHYAAPNWGLVTIGASNVVLDHVEVTHMGGSAIATAWGSNNITIRNSTIHEAGGSLWTAGMNVNDYDQFHYNADEGYYGTRDFAASTASYNLCNCMRFVDLSGGHDCCQTFTNNFAYDAGLVNPAVACVSISAWQRFRVTHNTIHDCPSFGFAESTQGLARPGKPSYGGIVGLNAFDNELSYNEIYNCGYETSLNGVRVPGSSMANDFGCLYLDGPQDGPGDGSVAGLTVAYNRVHDVSAGAYQTVSAGKGTVKAHGFDAILDYHDGNDSNGVNEHHNLFYNTAAVGGLTPYPTRLTQHTGGLRSIFKNNIWAGVFPAGSKIGADYGPRADVPPFDLLWWSERAFKCNKTCFVINSGNLYSFSGIGKSGTEPPACTSGSCSDGGITWSWVEQLPGNPYRIETNNITAWEVTGGGETDFPQVVGATTAYPQFSRMDYNLYAQTGKAPTFYGRHAPEKSFAEWQALGEDVHSLFGAVGPNFVNMAKGDFTFNVRQIDPGSGAPCGGTGVGTVSPACGLGFEPWDYGAAGAR